jgi:hypothetical protein
MSHSKAKKPDLDWSQVRETVKLLNLSAAQVDDMLHESEDAVNTLTDSFTQIVDSMHMINDYLLSLDATETREQALTRCSETNSKFQSVIIAFQFYDRLKQCLEHVTSNLAGLSKLVENPDRLYDPKEWQQFQDQIRARYTMESEKTLFDAILQGMSIDEAIAAKRAHKADKSDDIELF